MKTNKSTLLGDKKVNYPDERASAAGRVNLPWEHDPILRTARSLIILICDQKIGLGETVDRDYRGAGLTKEWIFGELIKFMPWLPKYVRMKYGTELTPHKCRQRFYMTRLDGTAKGECHAVSMGREHYLNKEELRPIFIRSEILFKRNTRISFVEAKEAGA